MADATIPLPRPGVTVSTPPLQESGVTCQVPRMDVSPLPTLSAVTPSLSTCFKPQMCMTDSARETECPLDISHSLHPYYANRNCNEGEGSPYTAYDSQNSQNNYLAEGKSGGLLRSERRLEDIDEVKANAEDKSKTPVRVQRLRDLWELGVDTARPRWSSNGGLGSIHYGTNSSSRLSCSSNAESDNDIIQCNNRLKLEEYIAESARIWELGLFSWVFLALYPVLSCAKSCFYAEQRKTSLMQTSQWGQRYSWFGYASSGRSCVLSGKFLLHILLHNLLLNMSAATVKFNTVCDAGAFFGRCS
ncbi:hypothetical protein VNO80_02677 [Phaseolus coccineus]|uniref:Uncharacterized protein n=1 Tax=Phaseolus coccineus TaxID=3886 RepID=A0AAN9RI60_PHACN